MTCPLLTDDQRAALAELESHNGWFDCRMSPAGRHAYRDLVRLGFAQGDGHGKYRITDDGREYGSKKRSGGKPHPKAGARSRPRKRPETPAMNGAVSGRRGFGSTEKILRRNRKTWTRLGNKRRRAAGKKAIEAET